MSYVTMAALGLYKIGWSFDTWHVRGEFVVHAHKGGVTVVVYASSAEVAMMEAERQAKEIAKQER